MNFRIIALASCIALGSIAFGGKAQAVDAVSTGTVTAFCSTNSEVPGTMAFSAANGGLLASTSLPATFKLTCNNTATVTVSTVADAQTPADGTLTTTVNDGGTVLLTQTGVAGVPSLASQSIAGTNYVDKPISVVHSLAKATNLTKGTYTFTSTVAITAL